MAMVMQMQMRLLQVLEHQPFTEADRDALRRAVAHPELALSGIDRLHLLAGRYRRAGRTDAALLCFYLARLLRPSHPNDIAELSAYRAERRVLLPHVRAGEPVGLILDIFASVTATHRLRVLQVARARIARVHVVNALGVVALFHSAGKADPGLQVRCGLSEQTVVLFTNAQSADSMDQLAAYWRGAASIVRSREGLYTFLDLTALNREDHTWLKQDVEQLGHRVVHAPWRPMPRSEWWASRRSRG